MALLTVEMNSEALRMTTAVSVLSPCDCGKANEATLYLLHGSGDDASTWHRLTNIELFAQKFGCTVIMPQVGRSYYTDMVYGGSYFQYITEELPAFCVRLLRMRTEAEKTFVAGISMGGYGALKCALTYPEKYAKAVSLSGVTDIRKRLGDPGMPEAVRMEMRAIFGPDLQIKPEQDLYALADRAHGRCKLPEILAVCGTNDPFAEMNRKFAAYMKKRSDRFQYVEERGTHDWTFWQEHLKMVFDFLFLQ